MNEEETKSTDKESTNNEKIILELQYQYYLNILNIITVSIISFLLTIWLSKDILVTSIEAKISWTAAAIIVIVLVFLMIWEKLNEIERKIAGTYGRD